MKRRNSMFGIGDPDFGFNKAFMSDIWLGSQMNMDSVVFRTIQWSVWDQLKQFTLVDIQHHWNPASHTLTVTGHDPRISVFCGLKVAADEQVVFDDVYCQKWISAHCKLQLVKKLGLFQSTLIGGVQINTSVLSDEANRDIEDCKQKFAEFSKIPHIRTVY